MAAKPALAWNRRSPVRVADAAAGAMAAVLAHDIGQSAGDLTAYADRHMSRALMPIAVMGLTGFGGGLKLNPRKVLEMITLARRLHDYLWDGSAAADTLEVRTARIRREYAAVLDLADLHVPNDAFGPYLDYMSEKLAREVPGLNDKTWGGP